MDNNQNKYIFSFLGGDRRQAIVANELSSRGHRVKVFGLCEYVAYCPDCEQCMSVEKTMEDCNVLVLPLPASRDGKHLTISGNEKIELEHVIRLCRKNSIRTVFGGILPKSFSDSCKVVGIEDIDYYQDERLQLKNALPSAEGAMMLAMEHTEITVDGMKVLIAGYGRIGAILASLLSKSGALVTVAARRDEVLCEANSVGYNVLKIDPLRGVELTDGSCFDVIFNTVPGIIFNSRVLSRLSNSPLYIEIASGSGGIDAVSARDRGIKIISAPSLPGKYAPITAGRYIYETIKEMCVKRGMKL